MTRDIAGVWPRLSASDLGNHAALPPSHVPSPGSPFPSLGSHCSVYGQASALASPPLSLATASLPGHASRSLPPAMCYQNAGDISPTSYFLPLPSSQFPSAQLTIPEHSVFPSVPIVPPDCHEHARSIAGVPPLARPVAGSEVRPLVPLQ